MIRQLLQKLLAATEPQRQDHRVELSSPPSSLDTFAGPASGRRLIKTVDQRPPRPAPPAEARLTTRSWLEQRPSIKAEVDRHIEAGTDYLTIHAYLRRDHAFPFSYTGLNRYGRAAFGRRFRAHTRAPHGQRRTS